MSRLSESPLRNLVLGVTFVLAVGLAGTLAYVQQGWSPGDALYMVIVTVFTVGYGEVRPVDTAALRVITEVLIVTGCTGMIFLTGALVQFITLEQMRQILGVKRMTRQIEGLQNHTIICGYGRIGQQLARGLRAGGMAFVIVEMSAERCAEAKAAGFMCLQADASDEAVLEQAGVRRARTLASVVPSDALNVFITLSARSLNAAVQIIARAEFPATERKLLQAGANAVVMPTHIGAELVASLILFPGLASLTAFNERRAQMEAAMRAVGLEFEVVAAEPGSAFAGRTVQEIETASPGQFLIIAVERAGQTGVERARPDMRINPGDGVTLIGRGGRAAAVARFAER
jgi:trk system potassium uptake protein TrkA/voltage-gated potassium channel